MSKALTPLTFELVTRYLAAGVWQEQVIHELVDAHDGAKEALCDQTRRVTYADLAAESNSLARFLLDAGVEDGVCVAVQSPNVVELAVAHLACSRIGATFVPLSDAWRQTELRHLIELSAA